MADIEQAVARLLEQYASKPPKVTFTHDELEQLKEIVKKNAAFRKLKDAIRLQAWQSAVPSLNADASDETFNTRFAHDQGFRFGMLRAVDLLEELIVENDDE